MMSLDEYEPIRQIPSPSGSRLKKGVGLTVEQQKALVDVCPTTTNKGLRDAAILALALSTGLRRSELVSLNVSDIDYRSGEMMVTGKGNKQRKLFVKRSTLKRLARYIQARGYHDGALFTSVLKNGGLTNARLSAQAIYNIVAENSLRAGLGIIKPHDLRKSFGTTLDRAGTSLTVIKDLLGHSDISTTDDYIMRSETEIRDAMHSVPDL
ncbi:tyrosine-type recombinase/integrase [Vibrio agarivorans]|uniref:tyrosine-type recombinase/integrase n=1 Tax=Vibrio agarivorans TaxID=153622 RepID=UPI0025B46C38|nr:tyrosine-type recombinase/integrase [Vibrio agarivorans]MDN3661177.1 tyrosine-type recombinase/integrase [Vibrio agarivorans]